MDIKAVNMAGSNAKMVERLVKHIDEETARLSNPKIVDNAEIFPQKIHMGESSQLTKLLDVI